MDDENSLERLFDEALSLPPGQRQAFVEQACPDPERRERLFRLLDAAPFVHEPKPGDRVGAYVIVQQLGHGGMGTVYLAEQPLLNRLVALKMIQSGQQNGMALDRFIAEQRALARLTHPNIATIYEAGFTDGGFPFFTMEYVDGAPIDAFCIENRLGISERLRLFRDLCAAVHFVHSNAVLHRDIKPGNVLVTKDRQVKLLDFGLAKSLSAAQPDPTVSLLAFTPSYASPEQIRGDTLTVQSDAFSLGVVLYLLLTGFHPFAAATPGLTEHAVLHLDPVRPSAKVRERVAAQDKDTPVASASGPNPAHLARLLQGDLDNIVMTALEKDAGRRYASVYQFSEDIQRHFDHVPLVAHAPTWQYRGRKFLRRYRAGVLVATTLLVILIASSVSIAWQWRVAQRERGRADRRFNDVRRLANSFLFDFDKAIQDVPGTTAAQQLIVDRAREYLDSLARESDDPQLTRELATAYEKVGDVEGDPYSQSLGEPGAALESYTKALALREKLPRNVDTMYELAGSHLKIADVAWVQRNWKQAEQNYSMAMQLDEQALSSTPTRVDIRKQLSLVYTGMGDTAVEVDDLAAAERDHQRSLQIRYALANGGGPAEQRSLAVGFLKLGDVANDRGEIPGAIERYQAALRIFHQLAAADPRNAQFRSNRIATLNRLGLAQRKNGQTGKALASQQEALALATEAAREDSSDATAKRDVASTESLLADDLLDLHQDADAVAHLRNDLRLQKELLAADQSNAQTRRDVWIATWQLGGALLTGGSGGEARNVLENSLQQAIDLLKRAPDDTRAADDLVDARVSLAKAMRSGADWKGALEQLALALPEAQRLATATPSQTQYTTRLAFLYSEEAKAHEAAAAAAPGTAALHRRLALEAWRACLQVSLSLDRSGELPPMDRPMLAEAQRKVRL